MTWGVHFVVSYLFAFSYCSWGSQGKNTKVLCHSLVQRTTFCQKCQPWPVHLGWPYMAWLIVSMSLKRLWSMWSVWLDFCDCVFYSIFPLIDKDKRLMDASWWERLTVGEAGSCSDGQTMLSKSLTQFFIDGWGCSPSLFFDLRPKTFFKRTCTNTLVFSASDPTACHCQPMPPPETTEHS